MKIRKKITITREDIRKGKVGDSCRCPIALAAKRALGIRHGLGVGCVFLSFPYKGRLIRVEMPKKAREFVHTFDFALWLKKTPKPFSFFLKA